MSKLARTRALDSSQSRYPITKKPKTLEELLSEWLNIFKKSWELGSSVPVDWSLIAVRDLDRIDVAKFSNDTLDVYPDYIALSRPINKPNIKNQKRRSLFETKELRLLNSLIMKISIRISNVKNDVPYMPKDERLSYSGEAVLWAFVLMRHRQLSNKYKKSYSHSFYNQIQESLRRWPTRDKDWEKIILLVGSGHGNKCVKCRAHASSLIEGNFENSKLVDRWGSSEAKDNVNELKLEHDLMVIWERYANNNSYGVTFRRAQFDGEHFNRPISKFIDKRIAQAFDRDNIPIEDTAFALRAERILNGLERQSLLTTANALAFSTSLYYEEDEEAGITYAFQPVDKSKITWYGNKHRIKIAEDFMRTPIEQFTSFTFQSLHEVNDVSFQSMLSRERDIFLDAVKLYQDGKMMRFAKEAFPATENIIRLFTAMIAQDNPDGPINTEAVIVKKKKNKELVTSGSGMFKDLGVLLDQLKGNKYKSVKQKYVENDKEPWADPLSLIEFFMTPNSTIGYGLNLRNEVAHGLIRRELTTDEGFAFMLSWLLAFELIRTASTERTNRRELIQKKLNRESWLCDTSFSSTTSENTGPQWLDTKKSDFAKVFWQLVDSYCEGTTSSIGPLRPERAIQVLRTIYLDEEIIIRWPTIWENSLKFRDVLKPLRQHERLIEESSQRLAQKESDEICKIEERNRFIRKQQCYDS